MNTHTQTGNQSGKLPLKRCYFGKSVYLSDFFCVCPFRAVPAAYGGSQARGPIGVVVAGLRHSHSKAGFERHL